MAIARWLQLESGPSGSGVFPMSFMFMFAGTFIFFFRLFMYDAQKLHPEIQVGRCSVGVRYAYGTYIRHLIKQKHAHAADSLLVYQVERP